MKSILTKLIFTTLLILSFLLMPNIINAQENNKFGIHVFDESDLPDASALVNSSGGEWGYVTIVVREDERDASRWQTVFNQMRRLKLIPIVRIATKMNGINWEIPKKEEAVNWAGFFNSLNWPIKNRYVVLFNEPNHAKEWGGKINPQEFAEIIKHYSATFKSFSSDFFILPGALDLAAPNSTVTMEASDFYEKMHTHDNFIFSFYDGLNSHSYPNPGFSGSANDNGKMSIQGYKWELDYLSNFGLKEDIPVFITETGWIRGEKDSTTLVEKYNHAFQKVWNDEQVFAVTPFLINYLGPPFETFSWKNPRTNEFLPHYYSVQEIKKVKGDPIQYNKVEEVSNNIPDSLISDSEYLFTLSLKNTGQSIISREHSFNVTISSTLKPENIKVGDFDAIEPNQTGKIPLKIKTEEPRGVHIGKIMIYKKDTLIDESATFKFTLVSPPSLDVFAKFWFGNPSDQTASLELYEDKTLITRFDNLLFTDGKTTVASVKNIVPNKDYSFILTKPFYIPANKNQTLFVGRNAIDFGRLIPLDLNSDGTLDISDIVKHIQNPLITNMQIIPH